MLGFKLELGVASALFGPSGVSAVEALFWETLEYFFEGGLLPQPGIGVALVQGLVHAVPRGCGNAGPVRIKAVWRYGGLWGALPGSPSCAVGCRGRKVPASPQRRRLGCPGPWVGGPSAGALGQGPGPKEVGWGLRGFLFRGPGLLPHSCGRTQITFCVAKITPVLGSGFA